MNLTVADLLTALLGYLPGAAVVGGIVTIIGFLIRNQVPTKQAQLQGEDALWKEVWKLRDRLDDKDKLHSADRERWERMMREEREECDRRIDDLEGQIRQLQQQQQSYGVLGERRGPLSNELRHAIPIVNPDPELDDLINQIP